MKIAVYCGAATGEDPVYQQAAKALGYKLAKNNIEVVYGGGQTGLMGTLAEAVLNAEGKITGVTTSSLIDQEQASSVIQLEVTPDMHARKKRMAELADAFIALPGGIGTLEEIFEVWTWARLGFHQKPCGLLNTNGYYNHLLAFIENMVHQQFMAKQYRDLLVTSADADDLVDQFVPLLRTR